MLISVCEGVQVDVHVQGEAMTRVGCFYMCMIVVLTVVLMTDPEWWVAGPVVAAVGAVLVPVLGIKR